MKKIIALIALILLTTSTNVITACKNSAASETYVYICDSGTAHVYHSSMYCRGLSHCTHRIIKVTLYDAMHKYDRRACKLCE